MANPNPNTKGLIPFQKGQSGNLAGRPRKFVTQLKALGYKQSEVTDTLLVMLSMTMDELKKVFENPQSTVLEKAVANAIKTSIARGSLFNIELILDRAVGKPKESIDVESKIEVKAVTVNVVKVDTPFASSEAEIIEDIEHEEVKSKPETK
jgi:hypothetical protein